MPRSLSEQVAVVTGASSGIGRATALVNLMGRVHGAAAALPQLAALQHWAPALTDRLMSIGKVGFSGQKTGEPDTGTDNLRAGAPGPGTVRGGYNGRVLERTRYTELLGQRPNGVRHAVALRCCARSSSERPRRRGDRDSDDNRMACMVILTGSSR